MELIVGTVICIVVIVAAACGLLYFIKKSIVKVEVKEFDGDKPKPELIKDIYSEIETNIQAKTDTDKKLKMAAEELITTNAVVLMKEHYKKIAECIVKDAVFMSTLGYTLCYLRSDYGTWSTNNGSENSEFQKYVNSVIGLSSVFNLDELYCDTDKDKVIKLSDKYHKIFDVLNDYLSLYNLKLVPYLDCFSIGPSYKDHCTRWDVEKAD